MRILLNTNCYALNKAFRGGKKEFDSLLKKKRHCFETLGRVKRLFKVPSYRRFDRLARAGFRCRLHYFRQLT